MSSETETVEKKNDYMLSYSDVVQVVDANIQLNEVLFNCYLRKTTMEEIEIVGDAISKVIISITRINSLTDDYVKENNLTYPDKVKSFAQLIDKKIWSNVEEKQKKVISNADTI